MWSAAIHDLPLFIAAALLLNLTPGPDMLYVAGTSGARGGRAGVAAALGVGAGCGLHIALGALGISALVAASPLAFGLLKWLGACYLVWAGIAMLRRRRGAESPPPADAPSPARRVFFQGALINALNPKVALFFLALLPQFIDAASPHQALAFVALGLLFDLSGTTVNVLVALAAGRLRRFSQERASGPRLGAFIERAAGVLFIGLGFKLALGARG
jgi:threonine/homoserine/homoserine lactone efflux protein